CRWSRIWSSSSTRADFGRLAPPVPWESRLRAAFSYLPGGKLMDDLQALVDDIHREISTRTTRGGVANYIPQLARVDPEHYGIAVATIDGREFVAGGADLPFSIQSVSKVFSLTLALGKVGDRLWNRVGREPSGSAFNSIVQLEQENGRPRNPFINAGAIVVADHLLGGHMPKEAIGEIVQFKIGRAHV